MELRGRKYKPGWMHANQAIYRVGGGVEIFRTDAQFHFFDVGYEWGGSYWKVHNPLSMEIWSLDDHRRPLRRLRKGPKVFYCFRDLEHTRPMRRSPDHPVYGACSQDPRRRRLRLGTSVGWSDLYPSDYDRQWVSVAGLRGCYAFVMRVDPLNLFYESNEHNNRSRPDRPPALPGRPPALLSVPRRRVAGSALPSHLQRGGQVADRHAALAQDLPAAVPVDLADVDDGRGQAGQRAAIDGEVDGVDDRRRRDLVEDGGGGLAAERLAEVWKSGHIAPSRGPPIRRTPSFSGSSRQASG